MFFCLVNPEFLPINFIALYLATDVYDKLYHLEFDLANKITLFYFMRKTNFKKVDIFLIKFGSS